MECFSSFPIVFPGHPFRRQPGRRAATSIATASVHKQRPRHRCTEASPKLLSNGSEENDEGKSLDFTVNLHSDGSLASPGAPWGPHTAARSGARSIMTAAFPRSRAMWRSTSALHDSMSPVSSHAQATVQRVNGEGGGCKDVKF